MAQVGTPGKPAPLGGSSRAKRRSNVNWNQRRIDQPMVDNAIAIVINSN